MHCFSEDIKVLSRLIPKNHLPFSDYDYANCIKDCWGQIDSTYKFITDTSFVNLTYPTYSHWNMNTIFKTSCFGCGERHPIVCHDNNQSIL